MEIKLVKEKVGKAASINNVRLLEPAIEKIGFLLHKNSGEISEEFRMKTKIPVNKTLGWGLKKFGRWFRQYKRYVERTQAEIEGELQAC